MSEAGPAPSTVKGGYKKPGFWALVVTQFQGAFNDNLFQYTIIYALLAYYAAAADIDKILQLDFFFIQGEFNLGRYVEDVASLLFSLPFILFPALFGALADRYSKQRVALLTKFVEVGIMTLGGLAFFTGNPAFIWAMLFFMATQSAMFGPAKYGILPEILPEKQLSAGNGIIQMTTMVAIIMGVGLAGPVYSAVAGTVYQASFVLVALSLLGMASAFFITQPPAANPAKRIPMNPLVPWAGMMKYFRTIWRDKVLLNVVIGYVYFWFAGLLVRNNLIAFSSRELGISETLSSYFLASVIIGIGIGALTAGFLSRGKIEMGLVPVGAIGMTVFAGLLAIPAASYLPVVPAGLDALGRTLLGDENAASLVGGGLSAGYYVLLQVIVFGLGFFAGMFDVPLAASIQQRAPGEMKGGVIATINMLTFLFMAFGSMLLMGLKVFGASPYHVFLVCAGLSLLIGLYISHRLPVLLLRSVLWILSNTLYRIRVLGRDNIPEEGGALFVSNHLSFVDALVLMASTDRQVVFVAGHDLEQRGWMRRLARLTGTVFVDPEWTDKDFDLRIEQLRGHIAEGSVVCISTEGPYKADGSWLPLQRRLAELTADLDAPMLPVALERLWGTVYTFEEGRFRWLWPKPIPQKVRICYGQPVAAGTGLGELRRVIAELQTEIYMERPLPHPNLHRWFLRAARRHLRKLAVADTVTGELSFFKTLVGSIAFGRKLKTILGNEEMVGVLLPPSIGGVLTNTGIEWLGKVPVNLNYTASNATLASCTRQCGIKQVVTSKKFLDRLTQLEVPGETVLLEDVRETVTGKDRVVAMLLALFAPARLIEKVMGAPRKGPDDLATVIFSSGSEGEPKGVMLTQRNVLSNIETTLEAFPYHMSSCVVGYLPFFHSFGFTVTLWMPLLAGIRGIYHANPLEPKVIGNLIQKYNGTIMIGTSTFLQHFIRRCTEEQMASLEFVVCGAEKLAPRVREAFKNKFGIEPLEGYGTTECAPVVSCNLPDLVSPGFWWKGTRHGTIGRTLPGVAVRTEDPETGARLPLGEAGLLLVKGPNIMKGYLGQSGLTDEVLKDGWYSTGDIAAIDEDGFITITDRLARFSKIGGEMVPHNLIEEKLHKALGLTEQAMAVASVPDEQKGERLVVLHTLDDDQIEQLQTHLDEVDLPRLWIPRAKAFYRISEIPVLATGKMDIKAVKRMASELDVGA